MARYEKGLFIYNGNSDSNELKQGLSQTLHVLTPYFKELKVIQTQSVEELDAVCKGQAAEVDVLFILGGDGTLHECINSLAELEKRPILGVLPGGTCNDFSRVLGIPQNLKQAAEAIMEGEEVSVDAGKTETEYFINFWGIGLVTQTSFNIDEEQKSRLGVLSYFISALKTMGQARPFEFTIDIDGERLEGEAVMILVMNGRFIGTRQVPVPTIDLHDGNMDVLIIKNSNLTLFKELMTMKRPWADEDRFQELHHRQGKEIWIEVDSSQEIDMDGEIKGETPASIKVLNDHFTFLSGGSTGFQLFSNGES
ncbi:YegS/Rv2252/BmrU family lipid kinase [Halobacillus mangrovi]|uniref:Diacylglycerol kinase n=1 Tax=Halobacillus mangrovi TaxID=402384 RepID=A0A1W5ZZQ9_9BACI|nr:YegS/Rv2252/BmrU family lipid kinase [Halobacillus mangrovi]ARI78855.1 diacylglycerol kinase [Halobacillus mangrovi]